MRLLQIQSQINFKILLLLQCETCSVVHSLLHIFSSCTYSQTVIIVRIGLVSFHTFGNSLFYTAKVQIVNITVTFWVYKLFTVH